MLLDQIYFNLFMTTVLRNVVYLHVSEALGRNADLLGQALKKPEPAPLRS